MLCLLGCGAITLCECGVLNRETHEASDLWARGGCDSQARGAAIVWPRGVFYRIPRGAFHPMERRVVYALARGAFHFWARGIVDPIAREAFQLRTCGVVYPRTRGTRHLWVRAVIHHLTSWLDSPCTHARARCGSRGVFTPCAREVVGPSVRGVKQSYVLNLQHVRSDQGNSPSGCSNCGTCAWRKRHTYARGFCRTLM